ncbi:hypothetical protein H2200_007539 [Cladophialophora chaetospira]|uniref:Uncharacterized protein n=1 Tax=Cladophialophora chaetospira TaxID=386627 RepID=A0AA38X8I4_9EURO|nr:hypothetical protein H2200_007539 [Cladophialophora chaetospira]
MEDTRENGSVHDQNPDHTSVQDFISTAEVPPCPTNSECSSETEYLDGFVNVQQECIKQEPSARHVDKEQTLTSDEFDRQGRQTLASEVITFNTRPADRVTVRYTSPCFWEENSILATVDVPCSSSTHPVERQIDIGGHTVMIKSKAKYCFFLRGIIYWVIRDQLLGDRASDWIKRLGVAGETTAIPLSTAFLIWSSEIAREAQVSPTEADLIWRTIVRLCEDFYQRSQIPDFHSLFTASTAHNQELMTLRLCRRKIHNTGAILWKRFYQSDRWTQGRLESVKIGRLGPLPDSYVQIGIRYRREDREQIMTLKIHHSIDEIRKSGWFFDPKFEDQDGTFNGDILPLQNWRPGATITGYHTTGGSLHFAVQENLVLGVTIHGLDLYGCTRPLEEGCWYPFTVVLSASAKNNSDAPAYMTLVDRLFQMELERLFLVKMRDLPPEPENVHFFYGYYFSVVMFRKIIMKEGRTIYTKNGAHPTVTTESCLGIVFDVKICLCSGFSTRCYILYRWGEHTYGFVVDAKSLARLNQWVLFDDPKSQPDSGGVQVHTDADRTGVWDERWEADFNGIWEELDGNVCEMSRHDVDALDAGDVFMLEGLRLLGL